MTRWLQRPRLQQRDETDMTPLPYPTRQMKAPSAGSCRAMHGIWRGRTAARIALLFLPLALAACGGVSMPIGSADVATPLDLTGSIDSQQNAADVDINQQDRAVIARTIATARDNAQAPAPFTWTNPISGNSGTILSLVDDSVETGTGCTRFETTANTIGGVRAYQGLACQDVMKDWSVIALKEKAEETQAPES
jgi:surface antigen